MKDFTRFFFHLLFSLFFIFSLVACEVLFPETKGEISASVILPSSETGEFLEYTLPDGTETSLWRSTEDIRSIRLEIIKSGGSTQNFSMQAGIPISTGRLPEGTYSLWAYAYDKGGSLVAGNESAVTFSLSGGEEKRVAIQLSWMAYSGNSSQKTHVVSFYDERIGGVVDSVSVSDGAFLEKASFAQFAGLSFGTWYKDSSLTQDFFSGESSREPILYNITLWGRSRGAGNGSSILYVSSTGDDASGDGTQANPVASFARAFEIIQRQNDASIDYIIYASGIFTQRISIGYLPLSSLTIASADGSSAIFDGEDSHQALLIKSETSFDITLENITIQNGRARQGAGINHQGTGLLTVKNCVVSENKAYSETVISDDGTETTKNANAGGISVTKGSLAVIDTAITNNYAQYNGGAIHISSGGTLTISGNSKIEYNTADYTAAAISVNNGICTMTGGEISNNSGCKGVALTIQRYGTFILEDGTISNNNSRHISGNESKTGDAGAIFINSKPEENLFGTFIMKGGKLIQNSAEGKGGAIYNYGGIIRLEGGEISENTAANYGGAVYINSGTFDLSGSVKIPAGSANNDIFLRSGNYITISGTLSALSEAKITPSAYTEGEQILSESASGLVAKNYSKFAVKTDSDGTEWGVNSAGTLQKQKTLNPSDSANITDPSIPYIIKGSASTNNAQIDINNIDINDNVTATEDSTYYITLDNVKRNAPQWASSFIIYNKNVGTTVTVYITVIGENKLFGHNHSGIKLTGVTGAHINVILNTVESGSIDFDATYSGTTDFAVERVTSTVRVESGCSFSGTSNGTTYSDVDAFFSAAKNSTGGSSFSLTK